MPKKARVAINGFGRIGRQTFNILLDNYPHLEVVAVNDLTDNDTLAHLLKYDSTYGINPDDIKVVGTNKMKVGKKTVPIFSERDPENLPWKKLKVDIVLECTGAFRDRDGMQKHINAGAKKVILSAPAKGEIDGTFVLGVNEKDYKPKKQHLIGNASCTTNCLAPMAKVLHGAFGIKKGLMTTIHSYTNDQKLLDLPHKDLRRARAAALSMIPTTTGAAIAVTKVLPALKGKLNGMAIRIASPTGSLVDLTAQVSKKVDEKTVNAAFKKAASGKLKGIMDYNELPLVSVDYHKNPYSVTIDGLSTMVTGDMVKILGWYDNEWGYSSRYADLCNYVAQKGV